MKTKLHILLAGLIAGLSWPAFAQECVVAFPERLGNWADVKNGRYSGPLIDSADSIFKTAGISVQHHGEDRWQDILAKFNAGDIDILAVAVKTPERGQTMKFVGPWLNYRWGPFYLEGTDVTSMETPRVGVNRALQGVWPIPTYLTRLHGEAHWDTPEQLMQKLSRGEIDVMLGEYEAILTRAGELNISVRELPNTEMRLTAYMAINKKSACMSVSTRLARAIRDWKQQGGWDSLLVAVQNAGQR